MTGSCLNGRILSFEAAEEIAGGHQADTGASGFSSRIQLVFGGEKICWDLCVGMRFKEHCTLNIYLMTLTMFISVMLSIAICHVIIGRVGAFK